MVMTSGNKNNTYIYIHINILSAAPSTAHKKRQWFRRPGTSICSSWGCNWVPGGTILMMRRSQGMPDALAPRC